MSNLNKINVVQKQILANFMAEHPKLAKNNIGNDGMLVMLSLWKELSESLNNAGPPVKDIRTWRKVYSDRKYQAKKKFLFNKLAKEKLDKGIFYKKKPISFTDIQIIQAVGLDEEEPKVSKSTEFAYVDVKNETEDDRCSSSVDEDNASSIDWPSYLDEQINTSPISKETKNKDDIKTRIEYSENIENQNKFLKNIDQKLEKLVDVQMERLKIAKELLEIEKKRLLYKKMTFKIGKSKGKSKE